MGAGRYGPDYPILMFAIMSVCIMGFAGSISTFLFVGFSVIVGAGLLLGIAIAVGKFLKSRRLDHEALYGPIDSKEPIPPTNLHKEF